MDRTLSIARRIAGRVRGAGSTAPCEAARLLRTATDDRGRFWRDAHAVMGDRRATGKRDDCASSDGRRWAAVDDHTVASVALQRMLL